MPIRFVCEHCQQRLSVSSRKVGAQSKCPKCKGLITVPTADAAEAQLARVKPAEDDTYEDPFSQFTVFDDDAQWVYETEEAPSVSPAPESTVVDPNKLAVSRRLIYFQGALLAVVAAMSFTLGILVGGATIGSSPGDAGIPQPAEISGKITYAAGGGGRLPDTGAVVVVLPVDVKPEQKVPVDGLVPSAPSPAPDDPGLQAITAIGGDYVRADVNGEYRVRVPDHGKYYVLVLSGNARRSPSTELKRSDLAQLGDFFLPAPDLLGQSRYEWSEQTIRRDTTFDVAFD